MKESGSPSNQPLPPADDFGVWQVHPEIPARFQADVWKKIAARQAEQSIWSRWREWTAVNVIRPQFAALLILAAGVAGGGVAQLKVQQVNARSSRTLESRYLASIDPYAHLSLSSQWRLP